MAVLVCVGYPNKRRYSCERDAQVALTRAVLAGLRRGDEQLAERTYRCPHCKGWHLTSQDHQ